MAKLLPYFKWYPADAETDENFRAMSDAEIGFYLRCLNHSWLNHGIPADASERARALKSTPSYVGRMWVRVGRCFELSPDDPTRLVNRRQEEERSKAASKSESATNSVRTRYERNENVAPRALARAESVSESESVSEVLSKTSLRKTEFESELAQVAVRMHDRHPVQRRCSVGMIETKLRQIAKKSPVAERVNRLKAIDLNHAGWCVYWERDGGDYAKALENWLAPSMGRFDEVPPQMSRVASSTPRLTF